MSVMDDESHVCPSPSHPEHFLESSPVHRYLHTVRIVVSSGSRPFLEIISSTKHHILNADKYFSLGITYRTGFLCENPNPTSLLFSCGWFSLNGARNCFPDSFQYRNLCPSIHSSLLHPLLLAVKIIDLPLQHLLSLTI